MLIDQSFLSAPLQGAAVQASAKSSADARSLVTRLITNRAYDHVRSAFGFSGRSHRSADLLTRQQCSMHNKYSIRIINFHFFYTVHYIEGVKYTCSFRCCHPDHKLPFFFYFCVHKVTPGLQYLNGFSTAPYYSDVTR